MNYQTELLVDAEPKDVFASLHQYKLTRRPDDYFFGPLVRRLARMEFEVLTPHTLGLGATYKWKIRLLGFTVLQFQEQIVEWIEGKCVAYRALTGWDMTFRSDLEPMDGATLARVKIDFTFGSPFLDRMLRPAVQTGLRIVCKGLIRRGIAARAAA